ncbi:hypothetical protein E1301_Tti015910 [Triplophysa tibetana]|uniref:Uncharacterized protein n=1 Tax=Triplophysa tibetana TaxID=1572043 RepID=A0A5A9PF48_9TELE|nr:hypothetical protein E1301_Tti015910 [Triplophysa tibetana]
MSSVKLLILIVICHQRVYAGNNNDARSAEVERVVADFLSLEDGSDLGIKGMPRDSLKSVVSSHNISSEENVPRQVNAVAVVPNSDHLNGNYSENGVAVQSDSDHMYSNYSQGEAAVEPSSKPGSDPLRGNYSQGEAAVEPSSKPGSDPLRGNYSQGEAALEPASDWGHVNNTKDVSVESSSYRMHGNNSKDAAALDSGSEVHGNYSQDTVSEKSSSNPSQSGDSNQDAVSTEESRSNPVESSSSIVIVYGNFSLSDNASANFISIASDVLSISVP